MAASCKLFLVYKHGHRSFQDQVLALADRLELLGLEVIFDQYEPNLGKDLHNWSLDALKKSDYVLCICNDAFTNAWDVDGVVGSTTIEKSTLLTQRGKVLFICFKNGSSGIGSPPTELVDHPCFSVEKFDIRDRQFEALYRLLTDQPVGRPPRGDIVRLPARTETWPEDLDFLPAIVREEVPRSGLSGEGSYFDMLSERQFSIIEAKRTVAPGRLPGSGSFLSRLAKATLRQGWEVFEDGTFAQAIDLARKAGQLDGTLSATSLLLQANSLMALKRYAEADAAFKEINELTQLRDVEKIAWRIAQYHIGGAASDSAEIEKIAESCPGDPLVQIEFADFLETCGGTTIAKLHVRSLLTENRDHKLVAALAVMEWKDGNVQVATDLLEESLGTERDQPTGWANLGVGRAELNRFGLAIEALRTALEIRPGLMFARLALAEIYALMGDVEASVELLRELVAKKYHALDRVRTLRTFDGVRASPVFQRFLVELEGS